MQKAIVNGKEFEVTSTDKGFSVNGNPITWDVAKISDQYFHVIYHNKSYKAELVKHDSVTKTVMLKINGHKYTVTLKDQFDLLLEKMGMSVSSSNKINFIKAPMPGLIIDLKVKAGDVVKAGDQLLILEAMKMENIIKAQGEGSVKSVKVIKGDSVEKGQVLIEF
jgi:biotin carboxyl carrier protein